MRDKSFLSTNKGMKKSVIKPFLEISSKLFLVRMLIKAIAIFVFALNVLLVLGQLFPSFFDIQMNVGGKILLGLALIPIFFASFTSNPYFNWRDQLFYGRFEASIREENKKYHLDINIYLPYPTYSSWRMDFEMIIIFENQTEVRITKKHMDGVLDESILPFSMTYLESKPIKVILKDRSYHREEVLYL